MHSEFHALVPMRDLLGNGWQLLMQSFAVTRSYVQRCGTPGKSGREELFGYL